MRSVGDDSTAPADTGGRRCAVDNQKTKIGALGLRRAARVCMAYKLWRCGVIDIWRTRPLGSTLAARVMCGRVTMEREWDAVDSRRRAEVVQNQLPVAASSTRSRIRCYPAAVDSTGRH